MNQQLGRALRFVTPYWRRLILVLALSLASTGFSLALPLLTRDFFDRALLGRDLTTLVRVALLFAGVTVAGFVVNAASGLRYTAVSADILFDMRLEMYRHLQRLSPRFYARARLGDILSRINNDIGEIQRIAAETALATVGNVLFLVGTVVMLAWLDLRLFAVSAATAPLAAWALSHYRGRLEREVATVRQRSADLGSFLVETLQAMRLVVTANAQPREIARFRDRNAAFVRALMSMQWLTVLVGWPPGTDPRGGNRNGVRLWRRSRHQRGSDDWYLRRLHGVSHAGAATDPGADGMYANLATVRVSLQRVAQILDEPIEVNESPDARALTNVRGAVTFDGVTVSFQRGAPVLEQVSFDVQPGETLAIVGPSGSGKSTIADLMLRLIDPDAGVVRLDGADLRTIALADLRRHVALVEQDPCLLHASIAENIRYARPDASDAQLHDAVRLAALDHFVDSLPQKLETIVGERGLALSAGERQRVAIARALIADPAVLVLDEPSAALDPVAEQRIATGFAAVMRGRTTIVITHRPELAARADRVLELDGTRVAEGMTR